MRLKGFKFEHVPRRTGKGGGVGVVYKSSIKSVKNKTDNYSSFDCVELLLASKGDSIRLCVVYRPPAGKHAQPVSVFMEQFQDYMDSQATSSGKLLVIGDFNFHMDKQDDVYSKQLSELLFSLDLHQHVSGPTHIHGHTLDLVLTRSSEELVKTVMLCQPVLSDHKPIILTCSVDRPSAPKKLVRCRKLKDIDIDKFKSDVQHSNLITSPASDVTTLVNQYNDTLCDILDKHAPVTEKVVTLRPHSPWFTEELSHYKRLCRQAERKWKTTGLTVHQLILKEHRESYNEQCRIAKMDYYCDKIDSNAGDQKAVNRIIDELKNKTSDQILPTENEDNNTEMFANFFQDKIKRISDLFNPIEYSIAEQAPDNFQPFSKFEPISEDDLRKMILSCNNKYCNLDPVPTKVIKDILDLLLPTLVRIVNCSLTSGVFPSALKTAHVTPLIKKRNLDCNNPKNYRPVSSLPYLSKIIEKVVVKQLHQHLSNNDLYDENQSAYRSHHSTETALVKIFNDFLGAADIGLCVLLIMLD